MQIVIQLRKFAEAVRRIKGAVGAPERAAAAGPSGRASAAGGGSGGSYLDRDISTMLRTEMTGIDPSLGGARGRWESLLESAAILQSMFSNECVDG